MDADTPTAHQVAMMRRDRDTVKASMTNDREAQRSLGERLKCIPRILAAKNSRLGRPLGDAELEDLSQETVIAVWNKRDTYNGHSTLETWVFPFCYHFLMNRLRKLRNEPIRVEIRDTDAAVAPVSVDYGFIHSALDELGPPDDAILRLKHFDQQSFTQIGQTLDISPNTAKSRYYRGIERMRVILHDMRDEVRP